MRLLSVPLLYLLFATCAFASSQSTVRLSSTIGPIDAGIVPLLADAYEKKTGVKVQFEGAGTGATLEKAKAGTFDLVMVHARKLEDQFVQEGHGYNRQDVMYNDFVILGPKSDPAHIRGISDAAKAFITIAQAKSPFVTRGDRSGTHIKEMEVWAKAGNTPEGTWYTQFPDGAKGNKATLLFTNEQAAYTLMDRATWLTLKDTIDLEVLVESDPILLNYIAVIAVDPAKYPSVQAKAATDFISWLISPEAQDIIKTFGIEKYGEPLFFPNAQIQ